MVPVRSVCVQQYWPVDGGSVTVGKFTVTNMGPELSSDNIIVTNLSVCYEGRLKVSILHCLLTEHNYCTSGSISL